MKFILFLFILFSNSVYNSLLAQNNKNYHAEILKAEELWKEFNVQKIKKELQKKTLASANEIDLFFTTQENYYHQFQHDFFDLALKKKMSQKNINQKYNQLLNYFFSEYNKFDPNKPHVNQSNTNKSSNPTCINADFEDGNTNGWDGFSGFASTATNPTGLTSSLARITIMTGSSFDSSIGSSILPVVAPGGTYSVRLEDLSNGANASRLTQTFMVQASNANFTYKYATVLEDGTHIVSEQAYFKVKVKDINGTILGCVTDSLTPTAPYTNLTYLNGYYYKNWTTRTIPLGAYIGQMVTIEFTAQDCTQSGHRGYAYVDGSCLPLQITASDLEICPGINETLSAPSGYDSYSWTGPGIVGSTTSQTITVNQPGNYQVNVTIGTCFSPIFITLTGGGITGTTSQLCPGDTTILSAPTGYSSYLWSGPGIVGANNTSSITIDQPGTYNISISGGGGPLCSASHTVSSIISPNLGPDLTICLGDTVQLNATGGSTEYTWLPNTNIIDTNTANPSVFPLVTTSYIGTTCNVSDTIIVNVVNSISGTTSGSITNCNSNGIPIGIDMGNVGDYTYSWTPSLGLDNTNSSTVVAAPNQNTVYYVTVQLGDNCFYHDSVTLLVPYFINFNSIVDFDSICRGSSAQISTIYEKECGLNGSICTGALSTTQLGTAVTASAVTNQTIFNGTSLSSRFQMLITKAELNSYGITSAKTLSEIGYKIGTISGNNIYQNFSIKMGCTSISSLTSTYTLGLNTVFNPKNIIITTGVNYYTLDNTFDWDGNSNIIIEICYNNASVSSSSSTFYSATTFPSFLSVSSISACNTLTGILSSNRPNIFLRHCPTPILGSLTYSWVSPIGLNSATISNPIATPTNTTTYFVTATDATSGCIFYDSVEIVVDDQFTIGLADSLSNCNTLGIQLSLSTSEVGNYTYAWTPSSTLNNNSINNPIASPTSSTNYHVTVTSENGCTIEDSIYITVPSLATFYVTPSSDSICTGQSIQLNSIYQGSCGTNGSVCSGSSTSVQIGIGTTNSSANNMTVYNGLTNGTKRQMLFTKTELNSFGLIGAKTLTHIGFNISSITGSNIYQNFTIKMGCTSQSIATTSFQTGLQTVFNTKNVIISNGINYYTFDNTFDWDGNSNIIVEICYNNASISSNSALYYSTTSSSMVTYVSGTLVCGALTGTLSTYRPNTYFKHCLPTVSGGIDLQWTPSATLNNDTIPNPIATPVLNTTYYVTATDTSSGCVFSDSVFIFNNSASLVLNLMNDTTICLGDTISLNAGSGYSTYLWNDGSTDSLKNVSAAGTYWVRVTNNCGIQSDTFHLLINNTLNNLNLGNDTSICSGSQITFNAFNSNFISYLWQNGSLNTNLVATLEGWYSVTATNICGSKKDSVYLNVQNPFPVDLGNDTTLCQSATLLIGPGNEYSSFLWQNNSTAQFLNVNSPGIYFVTATNACGNYLDSIEVNYVSVPSVNLGIDTVICQGESLLLNPSGCVSCSYLWQNSSIGNSYLASTTGLYYVNVTNQCGLDVDSINIAVEIPIIFNLGNDTILCQGSTIIIGPVTEYPNYLWQDNSTTQFITVSSPGIYFITATNSCGNYLDSIEIEYIGSPSINLGNDTSICIGNSLDLNLIGCNYCDYLWQDGATDATYSASNASLYFVNVSNQCGTDSDSINLSIIQLPIVDLGPDTSFCLYDSSILSTSFDPTYQYQWQNGSINDSLFVNATGLYWVNVTNQCGTVSDSLNITSLYDLPTVNLGNDTVLCANTSIQLNLTNTNCTYLWQDNSTSSNFIVNNEGYYWVIITDSNNCTSKDSILITEMNIPTIDLGGNISICKGTEYMFQLPPNLYSYQWQDNSTSNYLTINKGGIYSVIASNQCGSFKDTIEVFENECTCSIDVPTAFSPNKDGYNDVLYVRGNCNNDIDFFIYDRWGQKVFESHDLSTGWDGKLNGVEMNSAVFYYFLSTTSGDDNVKVVKKGNISLIK